MTGRPQPSPARVSGRQEVRRDGLFIHNALRHREILFSSSSKQLVLADAHPPRTGVQYACCLINSRSACARVRVRACVCARAVALCDGRLHDFPLLWPSPLFFLLFLSHTHILLCGRVTEPTAVSDRGMLYCARCSLLFMAVWMQTKALKQQQQQQHRKQHHSPMHRRNRSSCSQRSVVPLHPHRMAECWNKDKCRKPWTSQTSLLVRNHTATQTQTQLCVFFVFFSSSFFFSSFFSSFSLFFSLPSSPSHLTLRYPLLGGVSSVCPQAV